MNNNISEIITEVSIYSALLPIAFGIRGFKTNPLILNLFLGYLIYGAIVDIASDFVFSPNLFFNSFTIIQVLFYTYFLYRVINNKKLFPYFIGLLIFWCGFYVFCHLVVLKDTGFQQLSSLFDTMAVIVISFIAAAALVNMIKDAPELTKNPLFWFCLGIFTYTFCTYFVVSFVSNIIFREKLWWIHNIANISAYLLYAYGFYISYKHEAAKAVSAT